MRSYFDRLREEDSLNSLINKLPETIQRLGTLINDILHKGHLNSWVVSHSAQYTVPCPGLWVQASVMTNSFLDPSTTSTLSSWFCLVYLIWYYYLSVKFVKWILKQKIEIRRNLFKKWYLTWVLFNWYYIKCGYS